MQFNCPRCGGSNPTGAMFCGACGGGLAGLQTGQEPPPGGNMYGQAPASAPGTGLGTASMITGILALLLVCFLPVSVPLALAALITGIIHLRRTRTVRAGRGMAIAGVTTGACSLALGSVLIVFIIAMGQQSRAMQQRMAAYQNKPAPAFALADLQGQSHSLAAYRGRVVVLNFWSTW